MSTSRKRIHPIFRNLIVVLAVSVLPWTAAAQTGDYSYPDKMFGGSYTFTPKADEVMVRLAVAPGVKATDRDAERLAVDQGLEVVRAEGIDDHAFVVYRIVGKSAAAALAALSADPGVARVHQALLNADGTTRYFLPDQAVVQFDPGLSEAVMLEIIAGLGSTVAIDHWTPGFYTVTVPADRDVFAQIRAFNDLGEVRFAELSTISFNDAAFVPNDPLYANQWAMRNTGAGTFTNDADGDVQEAWDIERGNPNVIIAVIDTGVDWDHEDLQPNILQNLGEDFDGDGQTMVWSGAAWIQDPGDLNGIDDDGNGRVDDLFGWDFRSNDNNPDDAAADGHGTSCAGLAAAAGHNSLGVAGVAHGCRIMPLRVNLQSGMNQNRADAINYAVGEAGNYGAMVLSCSWLCSSGSTISVQNAVVNARAAGVLPVFAAGNANGAVAFPANLAAAMAVAATSPCDERKSPTSCDGEGWWGSNFGNQLSLGAPGVLMQTTDIAGAGGYSGTAYTASFNGTSSACPFTAGAVALLHSEAIELTGAALTPNDAQRLLEDSAEEVGGYAYPGGFSQQLGNGRINVNLALQLLISETLAELLPPPVDVALSIDRSFSMVGTSILAAENAAAQVVRLLDVGDKIAVTSYSGGTDPGGLPDWPAWTDYPMTEIVGDATKNAAIAAIETGGDVYNLTAIGAGLIKARDELFAASPASYPQAIILLSDGNNTDGPDPLTILPLASPQPAVYTIGFGSFADEITLAGIAAATGGEYFYAGTSGAKTPGGPLPLIQTYQLSLMQATERENLGWVNGMIPQQGEDRHPFTVDDSVDQILIALLWGHLDPQAYALLLVDPNGKTFDSSSPEWLGDETTSAFRITGPARGSWLALVRRVGGGEGSGNYHLNLAGSSRVRSHLTLFPHGFGQPILAELQLRELSRQGGVNPVLRAQIAGTLTYPNGEFVSLLFNDAGQDGDVTPDDGIYSAVIANTFDDGAYVVETMAYGQTSGNFPFTRYDLATAVLSRAQEPEPWPVRLPAVQGLPGALVEVPILAPQWSDPLGIVRLDLGFDFDPAVARFEALGDLAGTMMEAWDVTVDDQGDAVVLRGGGPPLGGQGLLVRLIFRITGPLGRSTPTAVFLLDPRNANNIGVPSVGHDGSIAIGSALPDRTVFPYPVFTGWSLRSLPAVLPPGETVLTQLPAVQQVLLWEDGGYVRTGDVPTGDGIWMQYGGPSGNGTLVGDPLGSYSRILPAGWSLLGGLFDQAAVPSVQPPGTRFDVFQHVASRGYLPAVQIAPGQGAWLHAAAPCTVTVVADANKLTGPEAGGGKVLSEAELIATGDAVAGVPGVGHVVVGGGAAVPASLPYPPAPPAYTTLVRLLDTGDPALALYSDARTGGSGEFWFLDVQPGGNMGGSSTTLSWSPAALRSIADVAWIMHAGLGTSGPVVIGDMRDVSSFTVVGSTPQQFTIRAGGLSPVDDGAPPAAFALAGNHPNPFNPMTTIRYDVPRAGRVRIDVFDLRGRRVAVLVDRMAEPGRHSTVWDGRDHTGAEVPSGVYFCRLSAEGVLLTDRMTLLK